MGMGFSAIPIDCYGFCGFWEKEKAFFDALLSVTWRSRGDHVDSKEFPSPPGWGRGISKGRKARFSRGFVHEAWEASKADMTQTRIDPAYGCRNIETPRKRFLLMRWNRNG